MHIKINIGKGLPWGHKLQKIEIVRNVAIEDFVENKEQADVPGPGTYEEDEIKLTGKNIVSKFKSSVSGIMTKYKRFHIPQRKYWVLWKQKLPLHGITTLQVQEKLKEEK